MTEKTNIQRPRLNAVGSLLLCGLIGLISTAAQPASEQDDAVDNTRTTLEKWVEVRQAIAKEQRDWRLGREVLEDRIALVEQSIESLRERLEETKASVAKADRERDELMAQNGELKQASEGLRNTVTDLEARTGSLLTRLPEPVVERVKPISQRFPKDAATTELSLSERFLNVIGVLNAVNKFNRDITVTSEVRELEGGVSAEVAALYLGIGQAYYVTSRGDAAGIGTSSPEGWIWRPANEHASDIAKAIAIFNNEEEARYVQLPLRVE